MDGGGEPECMHSGHTVWASGPIISERCNPRASQNFQSTLASRREVARFSEFNKDRKLRDAWGLYKGYSESRTRTVLGSYGRTMLRSRGPP